MNRFSQEHLSNDVLRREIQKDETREGEVTAFRLARIAEYDARKLYLVDAFPSIHAWCMGELRLSPEESKKRIRVARAGHRCPTVFEALADGRVNLSGMVCLATHLTPENAEELLTAAARKTRVEIEELLAERFPKDDIEARVETIPAASQQLVMAEGSPGTLPGTVILGQSEAQATPAWAHDRVAPLSSEAYAVQFTQCRDDHELFRYLEDLLGHKVPRGDIAKVYALAVKELVAKMERVRFGVCSRPRSGQSSSSTRYVPNNVKRAVFKRDGGQCTYVSESGRRCEVRGDVEFDHVDEFARGGECRVDKIRLRCRGHNQHTAEQTYGAGFMKQKREEAAAARAAKAAERAAKERAKAERANEQVSELQPHQLEVIPWLRELGCRENDCRIAVERCREMADARIEDRLKRALSWFGDRVSRKVLPVAPAASDAAGAPA